MSTPHDQFATANKHLSGAAQTTRAAIEALSPERRREAARSNIADIERMTRRYVTMRRDGTVQINRMALREAWDAVLSTVASVAARLDTGDISELSQVIEQVAVSVTEINRELKGVAK